MRVLNALGLDSQSSRCVVDWETYLKLQAIFSTGNMEKEREIQFWCKFFDKELQGMCREEEYMDILEKLVRGRSMQQAN